MEDLLSQLVKAIKSAKTAPEQVDLPLFKPDVTDAKKWLIEISDIKAEFEWSDQQTLVRVGRFLTGVSKTWFEVWSPDAKTWENFQRDFVEAFPPKKNLGRLLSEAAEFNSECCNTYDTYVFQKAGMLRNLRAHWEEVDIVELIIHGIKERDVQTTATNLNFKKISDLLAFLGTITKRKSEPAKRFLTSSHTLQPGEFSRKRIRENSRESYGPSDTNRTRHTCFKCGKIGHIQRNCPTDHNNIPSAENRPSTSSSTVTSAQVKRDTCTFCAKLGHNTDDCFTRKNIEKRRKINLCNAGKELIQEEVRIDGNQYFGIIDTGADISLIARRYLPNFKYKVSQCRLTLTGIFAGSICVEEEFKATLEMSNVTTELTFYVVPDHTLECDVIIGRNLYNDPEISTVTDHTGTRIIRNRIARIFRIMPCISDKSIDVPDKYHLHITTLLSRFPGLLSVNGSLSRVNNATLQIKLRDDFVVNRNPYRLAAVERKVVRDIVDELITNNIIRESESPFASPIILERKKEGSYRMCVDFRELNSHTVKDRFPLPLIDDQLDRLGKGRIFTSLDMSSGFHQIPIAEDSIEKTAFVTPDGHYEYLRMPFGLANAPAVFQRSINKALGNLKDSVALVYLDDILIPSETIEDALTSIELVLTALQQAGFSLNLQKCHFFKDKLLYLGREISAEGIRPGTHKIEALANSPIPATAKQVRQFMGLAGYFRKFIPEFATRTACITKLTRTDEPFVWTDEQEIARKYIIDHLTSRPLLAIFDPSLPTELHTDASAIGYGGILLQKKDGNFRVIEYFSKRTTKYEENYHSYELETLAVINALKHFRVYLLGINFVLVTDCNAIKSTSSKKDILPRVARWWSYMQDFNFSIVYRKGSALPHVDFLSRNPVVRRINANDSWLYVEQRGDAEVVRLINDSKEGNLDKSRYLVKDGILHYLISSPDGNINAKPFVPRQSRLGLLRIFHDEQCHIGFEKTVESIQKHFWFPRLRYFVKKYVKHCLVCAVKKTRTGPLQGFITNIEKPQAPMQVLHADCLGPLATTTEGYKHVLVLIDAFTKYCVLQPLKTVKADETRLAVELFISLFGTPKEIIMDAGTNFKNLSLPEYLDSLNINYHYTTPDIHRSNGQVERYMRTIMNLVRVETSIKTEWSKTMWKIQLVLNTTIQKSINTSPMKALIGIDGSTPLIQSLLRNLDNDLKPIRNMELDRKRINDHLTASKNKTIRANQKRRDTTDFAKGDFVLMHRDEKMHQGKLKYEFQGPFEIMGITPEGRYEIKRVGKSTITKAAKEQLREWPSEWSLTLDMSELLDMLEDEYSDDEDIRNDDGQQTTSVE